MPCRTDRLYVASVGSEEARTMRHIDSRLSTILAERKVAEAQSGPQRQPRAEEVAALRSRLGSWLISVGERLTGRETEPAWQAEERQTVAPNQGRSSLPAFTISPPRGVAFLNRPTYSRKAGLFATSRLWKNQNRR